jgi:hypothetical protein
LIVGRHPWRAGTKGNRSDDLGALRVDGVRDSIARVGTILLIGLKRLGRHGFALSMVGHVGLLLGLIFIGSSGVRSLPPEAMTVEIVPSDEAPQTETPQAEAKHVEGTPLESTSSGSELSSDAEKGSASAAQPRPKMTALPSPQQQAQADPKRQRNAKAAAAKPQATKPAEPETQLQASEPLLPPTAPTIDPDPRPKEAADQPNAGEMFAMPLALPGGRLGGGLDAPAPKPAMAAHDDTAAFRARLSSCSKLPAGIDEKVGIALRISFKRDGTLASQPQLLDASLSPDAALLMVAAVNALERCQPFSELSPDKYKRWKTLDLVVTPLALSAVAAE